MSNVYAVMENDKMLYLYRRVSDACEQAKVFADKKEKEYRDEPVYCTEEYSIHRNNNRIFVKNNIDPDYNEVFNYWIKSIDVIG